MRLDPALTCCDPLVNLMAKIIDLLAPFIPKRSNQFLKSIGDNIPSTLTDHREQVPAGGPGWQIKDRDRFALMHVRLRVI